MTVRACALRLARGRCGAVYKDCALCRMHPCSYHYNSEGETLQANAAARVAVLRNNGPSAGLTDLV